MEENNRPAPVATDAQGNNGRPEGAEGKNRRRRGHRGGKKHHERRERQQQNEQNRQEAQASAATEGAQEAPKPKQKQNQNQNKNQNQNQNRSKQENHGKNGGKQENRGGKQQQQNRPPKGERKQPDHFARKDDIYGDPQEEKELAEWRAKIVLNSAEPTAEKPAETVAEPTQAPVAIISEEDSAPVPTPVLEADEDVERIEVVGIRFRSAGKVYYFDPCGLKPKKGEFAIVETARGPEFGDVCMENTMVKASETITPLRPVIRIATPADIAHNAENRIKEKEALPVCQKKIAEHKLDMKLIDVQYAFDNSKLLFYFSSEGRVDFRELVKDLASVFRTRIELRQIGIRDEAKMLGGFGSCGRPLCCSTFLPDFAQVSIKMAKEQGLSLNSAKISGMCGRLMCCLRFESEVYSEEIKRTPAVDSTVKTEDGIGTVISTNPLAGTVRVVLKDSPDTPPKQYHRNDVTVLGKSNRGGEAKKDEKSE